MGRATANFFSPRPLGPWRGVKRSNIFYFQLQSHFQRFLCFLTNERYKTYQTGFSFCRLDHALGVGLRGAGGSQGGQKFIFFKHGHLAYQIDRNDQQNRMQIKFSS